MPGFWTWHKRQKRTLSLTHTHAPTHRVYTCKQTAGAHCGNYNSLATDAVQRIYCDANVARTAHLGLHAPLAFVNGLALHFLPVTAMIFQSFTGIWLERKASREEGASVCVGVCVYVCVWGRKKKGRTLINCGEITWFFKHGVCHQKPLHTIISCFSTVSTAIWKGLISLGNKQWHKQWGEMEEWRIYKINK